MATDNLNISPEVHRRQALWDSLVASGGPADVLPQLLRELGIYGGAQGVWVNKSITGQASSDGAGIAVGQRVRWNEDADHPLIARLPPPLMTADQLPGRCLADASGLGQFREGQPSSLIGAVHRALGLSLGLAVAECSEPGEAGSYKMYGAGGRWPLGVDQRLEARSA